MPGEPAVVLVPLVDYAEVSVVTRGGQDITSARFLFLGDGPDELIKSNAGHLKARLKAGRHDRVYVVARGEDGRRSCGTTRSASCNTSYTVSRRVSHSSGAALR